MPRGPPNSSHPKTKRGADSDISPSKPTKKVSRIVTKKNPVKKTTEDDASLSAKDSASPPAKDGASLPAKDNAPLPAKDGVSLPDKPDISFHFNYEAFREKIRNVDFNGLFSFNETLLLQIVARVFVSDMKISCVCGNISDGCELSHKLADAVQKATLDMKAGDTELVKLTEERLG